MATINNAFINGLLADASYVGGLTPSIDLGKALCVPNYRSAP